MINAKILRGVDLVINLVHNFSEVTGLHQRYANTLTEISIRPKLKVGIVIRSVYLQMVFRVYSEKKSNLLFLCILWETEALDGRNFDFQVPKWPKNSRQQSSEMFFGSVFWICLVIIQEVCDSWPMLRTTYLIILQGKQGSQIELFPIHSKVQMGYKPIIFTLLCTLLSGHFILQE